MPKVTYTSSQGMVESSGSGFVVDPTVGITNNDFLATFVPNAGSEAVSSGALSVASYVSFLNVTNTKSYSLANGTAAGQLKKVIVTAVSGTPAGTLTLATAIDGNLDEISLTTLGDTAELIWTGTAWRILALYNMVTGGVATPTVD